MTSIPATYRYYPSVPLSDLSDLYSVGDNKLDGQPLCIISFLPKVLRIGANLPITNKYVLFVKGTDEVDSILWSVKLYSKGELLDNPADLQALHRDTTELLLVIDPVFYDDQGELLFDRMTITCEVVRSLTTVTLEIEHSLVKLISVVDVLEANDIAGEGDAARRLHISNPDMVNYLLNCVNDYLTEANLTWNTIPILTNAAERENLLSTVTGIIYHNLLDAFSTEFDFVLDLDELDNKYLAAKLNVVPEPSYAGNYRNGLCRLPLYALNDAFDLFDRVPDFANIPSTNLLYAIIAGVGVSNAIFADGISDFDDAVPEFTPPTIKAAKERLLANRPRLIELLNLTSFPKSAIKLAVMLVKFLFECSKKNQCNECLNKDVAWPAMGFHQIGLAPDFWRNIVAHYLNGPSSKIKSFGDHVEATLKIIGSLHVSMVVHPSPRIVTAYFARKVIRKTVVGLLCFFERIDSQAVRVGDDKRALAAQPAFDSILGRPVYLVVETVNCRDKELIVGVKASDLSGNDANLPIVVGPETWNPAPVFQMRDDISVFVGRHDAVNDIGGGHAGYINVFDDPGVHSYNSDHLDKAIVKLQLRPNGQADFDAWVARLGSATANVAITVDLAENVRTFYGNAPALSEDPGEFLSDQDPFDENARFRVVNRILYEVFHADNAFNYLQPDPAGGRRRILRVDNEQAENRIHYFYHDRHDNDHAVCEALRFEIDEKGPRVGPAGLPNVAARGAQLAPTPDLPNPLDMQPFRNAGENIDATTLTFHANGTFVNGDGGDRWYPNTGNAAWLINADLLAEPGMGPQNFRAVDYSNRPTLEGYRLRITFHFQDTRRRFASPDLFAGVLGAVAQVNLTPNPDPNPQNLDFNTIEIVSEGLSYRDGSCYPSTAHRNGRAFDVNYLRTGAGVLRVIENQTLIDAMMDHGFDERLIGNNAEFGPLNNNTGANDLHDTHLHFGEFDLAAMQVGFP